MKKVGYVLAILLSGWQLYNVFYQLYISGKTVQQGTQVVPVDWTTASIVALVLILGLVGGIGGLKHQKWSKKLTIGAMAVVTVLQILQGAVIPTVMSAIVMGAVFFAD